MDKRKNLGQQIRMAKCFEQQEKTAISKAARQKVDVFRRKL